MIQRILIQKSPTFENLELHVNRGFNVLSGISGSGKSIFLHAILSAFGLKEPNATLIEVNLNLKLKLFDICLEDFGISESSDELVISVLKKQNVRYFINNQAISKKKLSEISKHFIKHISIKDGNELDNDYMLNILDSMAMQKDLTFKDILQDYKNTLQEQKQCKSSLQELEEMQRNIENLKDFAQFEIDKINKVQPQPGEYEKLMQDKKMLSKREKVMDICHKALQELDNIDLTLKALELLNIDNSALFASIMEARGHIENGLHDFTNLDIEPEALLERIGMLSEIIRRYGSEEEALQHLATQQQKLKEYEYIEFDKTKLEEKYVKLTNKLTEFAEIIHEKRKILLPDFIKQLNHYATQLRLNEVTLKQSQTSPYQHGIDILQIYLSNKQKNVLSSGEYNRMRLAMLCVAATCNTCDTKNSGILILDEIDANLSGEESEGVAKLLQFLSKHYQVFAISHQPFMPLLCDKHYLVKKDTEYTSSIKLLNKKERIKEIARMISGSKLNQHALSYAEKLLQQQDSAK